MKGYTASIFALALLAPVSAAAHPTVAGLPPHHDRFLRLVAEDFDAKRRTYEEKAQAQLDEWRQYIADWTARAKAKGQELSAKSKQDIDAAWRETKVEWDRLKQASAETWDSTRVAFEKATARMKASLHEMQSSSN